jgi:hypothetical protein
MADVGVTKKQKSKVSQSVAPVAAPVAAPVVAPASAPVVPDYGNQVIQSMQLPGGLATIESLTASPVTLNAPDLQDPMGEFSQRVQRRKAQLSIAK